MITVEYTRKNFGGLISHTDMLRILNKTFRRAGYNVNYSNGMGHHMYLKMTQPLPFGVLSTKEYVTADVKIDDFNLFLTRFNNNCPPLIEATKVYEVEKNPNLSAKIEASKYCIDYIFTDEEINKIIPLLDNLEIKINKDGNTITKNVSDLIYKYDIDKSGLNIICAFGANNLRIDLVVNAINEKIGTNIQLLNITRTDQLVKVIDSDKESFIAASKYLDSICINKYEVK